MAELKAYTNNANTGKSNASNNPWLRIIRCQLGPLEEWRGKEKGLIVQFDSNGTREGLRITASISKTMMGMPNPSSINIYNLAADTRNAIARCLTKCTLFAGWTNTDLQRVFSGTVISIVNERQGPDIISKLQVLPGYGSIARGFSSVTFGPGTPCKDAVKKLAGDLPGMQIADGNFQGLQGNIGRSGWSFAGPTKEGLDALSKEYGFSWTCDDGAVKATGDTFQLGGYVELNGEDGGLINITPTFEGPMAIQTGVNIKAIYVPGITVGSTVKVNSKLNSTYNGTYKVHQMNISMDAYSDSWTMDITSRRFSLF